MAEVQAVGQAMSGAIGSLSARTVTGESSYA